VVGRVRGRGQILHDARTTNEGILHMLQLILQLHERVPQFVNAPHAIKDVVNMVGLLDFWLSRCQYRQIISRLALFLLQSLAIPAARADAAVKFEGICCKCTEHLAVWNTFLVVVEMYNHALQNGFVDGRLSAEEACAIMHGICKICIQVGVLFWGDSLLGSSATIICPIILGHGGDHHE
jgi:hypothetical protein